MSKPGSDIFITIPINSSNVTDEQKHQSRRSIIREFCLNTSVHGLPRIAHSQSTGHRALWSISFLIFTVLMIYFVVGAIVAYFQYPTNMDITIGSEWPQYFPAVSICNASPFRVDRLLKPLFDFTNAQQLTNRTYPSTLSYQEAGNVYDFMVDKVNRNESILSYFYPLSSMLYLCIYNNRPCSVADFVPFLSASYGLCYTFNAKLRNSENNSVRYIHQDGSSGFFYIGLYVHSHQYVPYIGNGKAILWLVRP